MIYASPSRNTAFVFAAALRSQADPNLFQVNPTLAAGDFKISIDGGALADLASLPVVSPAASQLILISLTAAETNGENITIVASDAAGAEWYDEVWNWQTDSMLLQSLILTLGATLRAEMASLKKDMGSEFGRLRPIILDLKQSLARGPK